MNPLVSLIIPAFNAARWLPDALDSVLAQIYHPLEIIVVNDGSTDGTAAILDRYRNKHPGSLTILTQPNCGQCSALNAGLSVSTGHYIKFFDADDILSPEAVAVQVAVLASKPRHLAYGVWGRFYTDPSETRFTPHPGWHDSDNALNWIIETWRDTEPMYQCALFLIPRALINEVGGWDDRLGLINDFEFFTRLVLAADGICFTPEARLYYRSGLDNSLSGLKSRKGCESACLSIQLGVRHLLARENSPRTKRVSADVLQAHVHSFYPRFPDLLAPCMAEIKRLGGSQIQPQGGLLFRLISAVFGWRFALRIRHLRS